MLLSLVLRKASDSLEKKNHLGYYRSKPVLRFMQSMLIILISGDVQLNPGPKTRLPCGICRKNVNKNQKAMECETCLKWYHNKCTGMKDALYHIHMEHESFVWICSKCGMPNLSNSTLSLDRVNTSNSFDALINLDLESSKECVTIA